MKLSILALCTLVGIVMGRPMELPQPPLIPPGFQEHLPAEAKEKLIQYHFDKDLTFEQRRDKIETVLDELPREVLEKLPLPPGLERLPEESKAKFKELHMNRNLSWRERHQLVQKAISELPEDQQKLVQPPHPPPMMMGFPPHPPPGFEFVLAPTIYKQLMAVHSNPDLSIDDKKRQIDQIMSNVPQEQLDKLPLPPGFDRLSPENQQRVRQLMHDFKLDWDSRHERVREFIKTLPREERRAMQPRPPPGFENLPEETKDQIDDLFMNDKLTHPERHAKIHELIQKLPIEIRSKLPFPPMQ